MTGFLEVTDLARRFGRRCALNGLSFSIPQGAVAAFIGANGAGKTTTFSIIGQFLRAHGGEVRVNGLPLAEFRRQGGVIGLLPQDVQFYETRAIGRQLFMFARLAGFAADAAWTEVDRVLKLAQLGDRIRDNPANLSRGMKVRLGVAQALIGAPPLVLLDEPTAGLDPMMQRSFRENVEAVRGRTTLVISSHDLRELQELCDYVCIIDQGRLIRQGTMREVLGVSSRISLRLEGYESHLEGLRAAFETVAVTVTTPGVVTVQFDPRRYQVGVLNRDLLRWLLDRNVVVLGLESEQSLEQVYADATRPPGR